MRKILATGLIVFISQLLWAQGYGQAKYFPDDVRYETKGWYAGPGLTYGLALGERRTTFQQAGQETVVVGKGTGQLGWMAEGGRFKILEYDPIFKYLDYGLQYHSIAGKREQRQEVFALPGQALLSSQTVEGTFRIHVLSAQSNLNHVWPLGTYSFLLNAIGINAEYAFAQSIKADGLLVNNGQLTPGRGLIQLHYKIGYGMRVEENVVMIPTLQVPILSLLPFDNGQSSLRYLGGRYQPLVFSLRFLFFKEKSVNCPPVYTPEAPGGMIPGVQ